MDKLDFKKLMKRYWSPPVGAFEIVDVPAVNFAMIDGRGDPNRMSSGQRSGGSIR